MAEETKQAENVANVAQEAPKSAKPDAIGNLAGILGGELGAALAGKMSPEEIAKILGSVLNPEKVKRQAVGTGVKGIKVRASWDVVGGQEAKAMAESLFAFARDKGFEIGISPKSGITLKIAKGEGGTVTGGHEDAITFEKYLVSKASVNGGKAQEIVKGGLAEFAQKSGASKRYAKEHPERHDGDGKLLKGRISAAELLSEDGFEIIGITDSGDRHKREGRGYTLLPKA